MGQIPVHKTRSGDSDFQENAVIKSKVKRLTFKSVTADNRAAQGFPESSRVGFEVIWEPVRRKEWK